MKHYLITAVLIIAFASVFSQQHPRILFNSSEKAALQLKSNQEPFGEILHQVRIQYNKYDLKSTPIPTNSDSVRDQAIQAALGAFLYSVTDSIHYAQKAMLLTRNCIYGKALKSNSTTQYADWGSSSVKGLTSYFQGTYISLAYDMCSQAWPDTFNVSVSKKLIVMGDMISTNGGAEQNTNTASNWQGARGAAALLCYLSSDETYSTTNFQNSLYKMNTYLIDNLGDIFNSKGWNVESLGYMYYPMGNYVAPAIIALRLHSPTMDFRKYPSVINNYCTIFSSLTSTLDYKDIGLLHPDFGDDNPGASGEGTFGQAFYFLPDSLKQGAKFCYDKLIATNKNQPYDNSRYGIVYSYLYYPTDVIGKNPKEISAWNDLDADCLGNGYFNFRNKYENNEDALAQMY
ncbi:MAG: hypothetical protein GZ091_02650, partial [Paludibacter sp.]|nr:hypothetical protein [Paludibacter sp.]